MPGIRSSYTDSVNFFGQSTPRALVEEFGTPLYVYSEKILRERCRELVSMCKTRGFTVNYSAKANTNPALLSIIREEGLTVDAMSPGELHMDLLAGFDKSNIFYISNNISPAEMKNAKIFNMIVLGGFLKVCPIISVDGIEKALCKTLPERHHNLIPLNMQALDEGGKIIEKV